MKKIIITAVLLLSGTAALFANPGKSSELLAKLNSAMANTRQLNWNSTENHEVAVFNFQGNAVKVYKDEAGLIGFFIYYKTDAVPAEMKSAIEAKLPGIEILEAAHFIDESGNESDYVSVMPKKEVLVYQILNGKARYFGK